MCYKPEIYSHTTTWNQKIKEMRVFSSPSPNVHLQSMLPLPLQELIGSYLRLGDAIPYYLTENILCKEILIQRMNQEIMKESEKGRTITGFRNIFETFLYLPFPDVVHCLGVIEKKWKNLIDDIWPPLGHFLIRDIKEKKGNYEWLQSVCFDSSPLLYLVRYYKNEAVFLNRQDGPFSDPKIVRHSILTGALEEAIENDNLGVVQNIVQLDTGSEALPLADSIKLAMKLELYDILKFFLTRKKCIRNGYGIPRGELKNAARMGNAQLLEFIVDAGGVQNISNANLRWIVLSQNVNCLKLLPRFPKGRERGLKVAESQGLGEVIQFLKDLK
jgi:hypothetical protein